MGQGKDVCTRIFLLEVSLSRFSNCFQIIILILVQIYIFKGVFTIESLWFLTVLSLRMLTRYFISSQLTRFYRSLVYSFFEILVFSSSIGLAGSGSWGSDSLMLSLVDLIFGENWICQNWNLSEFGFFFTLFEGIGNCLNWKLSELEFVRIRICQNWNLSELEIVRIGNWQNWNLSVLEFVRIWHCQSWNSSEF